MAQMAASFEPEDHRPSEGHTVTKGRHFSSGGLKVSDSLLAELKQKHAVETAPDRAAAHTASGPRVEVLVPPGECSSLWPPPSL